MQATRAALEETLQYNDYIQQALNSIEDDLKGNGAPLSHPAWNLLNEVRQAERRQRRIAQRALSSRDPNQMESAIDALLSMQGESLALAQQVVVPLHA